MKYGIFFLVALVSSVICCGEILWAQTYISVSLTARDNQGSSPITLVFGQHQSGTYCIDGALGEAEQPPPGSAFDVRFVESRTGSVCLGQGLLTNYHYWTTFVNYDTFRIQTYPINMTDSMTLTWPSGLSNSYFSLLLKDQYGNVLADMRMVTSLKIRANVRPLWIYATYVGRGLPTIPSQISPGDGASDIPLTEYLIWGRSGNATKYVVQVSTTSSFGTILSSDTVSSSDLTVDTLRKQLASVSYLTQYYWRVRSGNLNGWSNWSSVRSFRTIAATPSVTTEIASGISSSSVTLNGTINPNGASTNGWFEWGTTSTLDSYIATSSSMIGSGASSVPFSTTLTGLAPNTMYYFRVGAQSGSGTTRGVILSFTTLIAAPSAPMLVVPVNGDIGQSLNPTLSWNISTVATGYRFQLSIDSSFTTIIFDDSAITSTSVQLSGLAYSTIYYWRVNARNSGGISPWSERWRFSTVPQAPNAPLLSSPADGSANNPTTVTLSWLGGDQFGIVYNLQVAKNASFSNLTENDSGLASESKKLSQLENNTTYYWRVQAINSGGASPWSTTWSFTTIVSLPNAVALISPSNNAQFEGDSLLFIWSQAQPNVIRYWFELGIDSLFSFRSIDSNVTQTFIQKRGLLNSAYWWKVRAFNAAGWGPYSENRRVSRSVTEAIELGRTPTQYQLHQNFPNPFNPATTIQYEVPRTSKVKLAVYDLIGREVAVLVDEDLPPGSYSAVLDASMLPNGVYFYRLIGGAFVNVKKLVIAR